MAAGKDAEEFAAWRTGLNFEDYDPEWAGWNMSLLRDLADPAKLKALKEKYAARNFAWRAEYYEFDRGGNPTSIPELYNGADPDWEPTTYDNAPAWVQSTTGGALRLIEIPVTVEYIWKKEHQPIEPWPLEPEQHFAYAVYGDHTYLPGFGQRTERMYLACQESHISVGSCRGLRARRRALPATGGKWCPVCDSVDLAAAARTVSRAVHDATAMIPIQCDIVVAYLCPGEVFAASVTRTPEGFQYAYLAEWVAKEPADAWAAFSQYLVPVADIGALVRRAETPDDEYMAEYEWWEHIRELLEFAVQQYADARRDRLLAAPDPRLSSGNSMTFAQYLVSRCCVDNTLIDTAIAQPWYKYPTNYLQAYLFDDDVHRLENSEFDVKTYAQLAALGAPSVADYHRAVRAVWPTLSRITRCTLRKGYHGWCRRHGFRPRDPRSWKNSKLR